MWKQDLNLLEFVGGPFDGFSQLISVESNELPACVALPLNRKAGRLLGFKARSNTTRVAIYRLDQDADAVRYHFRSIRVAEKSLQAR